MPQRMVRAGKNLPRRKAFAQPPYRNHREQQPGQSGPDISDQAVYAVLFLQSGGQSEEHFGRKKGEEKIRLVLEELYAVKSETA